MLDFELQSKKLKTCCFTGRRKIARIFLEDTIFDTMKYACQVINQGVTDFICGGALGFDTIAARAIIVLRKYKPQIRLILYLPCKDQDKLWSEAERAQYRKILKEADEIHYISEEYDDACMMRRNRAMVEAADVCICWLEDVHGRRGGTAATVRLAHEKGIEVFNVSPIRVIE